MFPWTETKFLSFLDFVFVDQKIKSAVRELNETFIHLIKDIKPELIDLIHSIGETTAKEISKSCRKNVENLNDFISQKFQIPDNVDLFSDGEPIEDYSNEDAVALRAECEFLEKTAKEVISKS